MNDYQEFGLNRDAITAEIREAYKLAARLLHPDTQREPRLKDMADCQMKRLSNVVAAWASSAGAKGEWELTLRSPNQLHLKWWTTQFGRQEALSSGMAVLLRLNTP